MCSTQNVYAAKKAKGNLGKGLSVLDLRYGKDTREISSLNNININKN